MRAPRKSPQLAINYTSVIADNKWQWVRSFQAPDKHLMQYLTHYLQQKKNGPGLK